MIIIMAEKGLNNEIGKDNELIWNLKYDQKLFKEKTEGSIMVMGRNTFNSLPGVFPNRKHIVLSTTKKFNKPLDAQIESISNVLDLIKKCRKLSETKDVYIIGGESMYNLFIDYADKMYITQINEIQEDADAFFPEIDENVWEEKVIENRNEKGIDFSFIECSISSL
jgi:dihydrofolate reductase